MGVKNRRPGALGAARKAKLLAKIAPLAAPLLLALGVGLVGDAGAGSLEDGLEALRNGFPSTAFASFRQAGENGDAQAQFLVGRMYQAGEGTNRDEMKAAAWYRRAADQGHAEAQTRLGFLYLGAGELPRDDAEALKWFNKAASQDNHPLAQAYLCSLYSDGAGPEEQREALALEWCRRAAEQGIPSAQTLLGMRYALGAGVAPDPLTAHKWFSLAATQGYAKAAEALTALESGMTPQQRALLPNAGSSGDLGSGEGESALTAPGMAVAPAGE